MERATVVRISIGGAAVVALVALGIAGVQVDVAVRDWLMAAAGTLLGWMLNAPGQVKT